MTDGVRVKGLREFNAAIAKTEKQTRTAVRRELRVVAEPVRREAEALSRSNIPKTVPTKQGVDWSQMRTGLTRRLVYVAPKQRGLKGSPGDPRRRPKFAKLLMDRAMEPALERHHSSIVHETEVLFNRIAEDFNH